MAVLALASLAGCYLHRLRDRPDDGGTLDATVLDARARDSDMIRADAPPAPLDAGLVCPLARADFSCFSSLGTRAGRPFTLPLSFDACACCPSAECAVAVDPESQTLRLTSTLCPDPCDCAACNTPIAACAVPALAPGFWVVEVNGTAAFGLPVADARVGDVALARCADFAEADACSGAAAIAASTQTVSSACVHGSSGGDRYWLDVTDDCGTCDREGTCLVTMNSWGGGREGGMIDVRAYRFRGACDSDCPAVCMAHTRRCELPPLANGGYYEVVSGIPLAFTAGVDTDVCVTAPGG